MRDGAGQQLLVLAYVLDLLVVDNVGNVSNQKERRRALIEVDLAPADLSEDPGILVLEFLELELIVAILIRIPVMASDEREQRICGTCLSVLPCLLDLLHDVVLAKDLSFESVFLIAVKLHVHYIA